MKSNISTKVIEDFYAKDKNNILFWVSKTEKYSKDKVFTACTKTGASEDICKKISYEIDHYADNRIKMSDIRPLIYALLAKYDPTAARRFKAGEVYVQTSSQTYERFNRSKIAESLVRETGMEIKDAEMIAFEAEKFIKSANLEHITSPLVREIVNVKLVEHGFQKERSLYTRIGMPVYDLSRIIEKGSKENANLQYNPETIHKIMADTMSKEYTLLKILPKQVTDAHILGQVHVHDLDYFFSRPFCFSHDVRYFIKNGFRPDGTGTHTSIAGPAKKPEVAFLHAAKVLAAAQTNCAGGQGFSFFNTFMAPVVAGLNEKQMRQMAQLFIYEMTQMYVARGGQTVFSSIDLDMSVPNLLKDVPVIGLRGSDAKGTYGDYEDETKKLFNAFLDVYTEGDYQGKPFNFPKFEVTIDPKHMNNGNSAELFKVSELAAKFGTPYYIIKQPYMPEFSCYQCCAFLMPLETSSDKDDMLNGTVRGGSLQVVTINLPQIAYESDKEESRLFQLIDERMDVARQVMLLRKDLIEKNLKNGMLPFLAQKVNEKGDRYYEPSKQSFTIGMVGINEMVKYCTGSELHETQTAWMFGLKVMKYMKDKVAKLREETGLNFALARTPAETTAYRFATIDKRRFPTKAIYQGDVSTNSIYYTNSFHVRPNADVPLFRRMQIEGAFHPLTDGGAMCLDYNEKIIVNENGVSKIIRIGDFVEQNLKNKKHLTDGAIFDDVKNFKTIGISKKNKAEEIKILKVMKIPVSDSSLFEIRTKNNKKLRAVGKHKIFKLEDGAIKEVFVKDLKKHETILMLKNLNINERSAYDLAPELSSNSDIVFNEDKSMWKLKRTWNYCPTKLEFDRNFGELMGFMVSEGFKTISEKTMINGNYSVGATFGPHENYYADYFRNIAENIFSKKFRKYKNDLARELVVETSDKNLHYLFSNMLNIGANCSTRTIPDEVLFSNRTVLEGLLDAAFAGDGTIDKRENKILPVYCTTSSSLADGVSFVSTLCGYENSKNHIKRSDGREFYNVTLLRDSGSRFVNNSKLFRAKVGEIPERKSTMNGFLLNYNATPFGKLSEFYIKNKKIGKYAGVCGDQMKKLLYLQHENKITDSKAENIICNWIKILNELNRLDKILCGGMFCKDKITNDTGISKAIVRKSISMFRKNNKYIKNNYFSETTFSKVLLKAKLHGAIVMDRINQDINRLKKFRNILNNLGFDIIKDIKIVETKPEYVYDIQTETGNFFTEEGILNHNSHIWLGDANPDPEAVMKLTKDIATKTAIQYMAFTKDLTICNSCGFTLGNLVDSCPSCQSKNVQSWSRITGYYQNITGWNKGKLQELKDRRRYGL